MSNPSHEITVVKSRPFVRVLCACGGLRRDSYNRWLLRSAGEPAPPGEAAAVGRAENLAAV